MAIEVWPRIGSSLVFSGGCYLVGCLKDQTFFFEPACDFESYGVRVLDFDVTSHSATDALHLRVP